MNSISVIYFHYLQVLFIIGLIPKLGFDLKANRQSQQHFLSFLYVGCRCATVFIDLDSILIGGKTLFDMQIFQRTMCTFNTVPTTFAQICKRALSRHFTANSRCTTSSHTSISTNNHFFVAFTFSLKLHNSNYCILKEGLLSLSKFIVNSPSIQSLESGSSEFAPSFKCNVCVWGWRESFAKLSLLSLRREKISSWLLYHPFSPHYTLDLFF